VAARRSFSVPEGSVGPRPVLPPKTQTLPRAEDLDCPDSEDRVMLTFEFGWALQKSATAKERALQECNAPIVKSLKLLYFVLMIG
jgi:hypothetical protein